MAFNRNGEFEIKYDYTDLNKVDLFDQRVIWCYENLGMTPKAKEKESWKALDTYLNKKNED